nr:AsmA-like C-terminal region-containing protein [Pontibacter harenae]
MALALGGVYAFQDKIIAMFVAEANKHVVTKVEVGEISLSLFEKFPQVAISLDKVNIIEALPESNESLARADKLYFTFSLWDVVMGDYTIKELHLEEGEIYVKVLPNGQVNYNIVKTDTTAPSEGFSFNLEKINLHEVAVNYIDQQLKQTYALTAHDMSAALGISPETTEIKAVGKATVQTVKVGTGEYFKGKQIDLNTALLVNTQDKKVQLQPSIVKVGEAAYEVGGNIDYADVTHLDLKLKGQNTNIQSLLSLLPQNISEDYRQYRSEGDIYFSGTVVGNTSEKESPEISFDFGCTNASFYHPDVKQRVDKLSFNGSFTNGNRQDASTSVLELKGVSGVLNGRPFSGNLNYKNFDNPTVAFDAKGKIDVAYVLGLLRLDEVRSGSGIADVKVAFAGNLNRFKAKPGNSTLSTSGDITLHNVGLSLSSLPLPLTGLNGNFMFKHNDVAVSGFSGKIGDSDFQLNGLFRNVIAWLLLDKQRLLVEADLQSNYLNFDQLLNEELNNSSEAKGSASSYRFTVSPDVAFDLSTEVKRLQFRRFKGKNIKGEVKLRNQVVSSPNISFNAIGGRFAVKGTLDARKRDHVKVTTASVLQNMSVDSLFYVFENFKQSFIEDRHLRGVLSANIASEIYFDSHLNPKTDLLQAEIAATVLNGKLINFSPMQKMSAFVKRHELANLHFAELRNSFWIQQGTIFIPEMDIRSSLSAVPVVSISGTHTFDQDMDYKIKLPLSKNKKLDKDSVYGVVADDTDAGDSMLFLTLKGKESNFKIAYDNIRVREKISKDLQQEGKELKDLLKGKKPSEKEKKVELQQDEYFDFDE